MLTLPWFKKANRRDETATVVPMQPPDIPGLLPVKSVDELLARHGGLLVQLDELAGLSKPHFQRYYLAPIRQFARFVQQLPASEVHHHAGPGGMLAHTLEVCVTALKVRRSYLLSESGAAEDIAATQDLWTFAVFLAALCHDLAKVAVDQTVTVYDRPGQVKPWDPWHTFLDEQGSWYLTEFVRGRSYRLHEKASLLLLHRIVPAHALNWLTGDRTIFSQWLACVAGDGENAASIGEIVGIADGKSVSANLGADPGRMPTVKTKPLHEKMLTALRHLLHEGELPLNRNGAAGWLQGEDIWLVSKRTVDAIRDQLNQEGHAGVPTKNGRMFDILQEQGVLIPYGDKAIWPMRVEGDEWSNDLTLIRIASAKIWPDPNRRPTPFEGRIVPAESVPDSAAVPSANTDDTVITSSEASSAEVTPIENTRTVAVHQNEPVQEMEPTASLPTIDQQDISKTVEWSDFLPTASASEETDDSRELALAVQGTTEVSPVEANEKKSALSIERRTAVTGTKPVQSTPPAAAKKQPTACLPPNDHPNDPAERFFEWLRAGVSRGTIKTNRPKARVHVVTEGVALITPGIFQDYVNALAKIGERLNWLDVQKKVLKKNRHVRNDDGLNVIKYRATGQQKNADINVILFDDASLVFGENTSPAANPHLNRV